MKVGVGAILLFIGLFLAGFSLAECIVGDQNCFLEWWILAIPLAGIGYAFTHKRRAVAGVTVGIAALIVAHVFANPDSYSLRRETNEIAAWSDVTTLVSAEAAYATSNGGYYDRLECLVKPTDCISSYPPDGKAFLSEPLDGLQKGFVREFLPGPPAGDNTPSSSSIQSYTFIAYPAKPGATGWRSYCGDSSGRIWVKTDGSRPLTEDGKCEPGLTPLE